MTMRLDIVSNDAGDMVRREHARELGAGVVVALYRLARQAQLHDLANQAFVRQLEQTHQIIGEYCLRSGTNVNILFAQKAVFVAGQLLKGSRGTYESAAELAELLDWCGGSELSIARDVSQNELLALAEAISAAMRGEKGRGFRSPSPKISLRAVGDAARLRGLEVERLPIDQRIARNYANAVVVLRRFFDDLAASRYILPRRIKRIAQNPVDLSAGNTPAFLGVTEARNQNHDAAGRAVNTAILALVTAREITSDRAMLAQIAMAAMMHDVGRPRALALATAGGAEDLAARRAPFGGLGGPAARWNGRRAHGSRPGQRAIDHAHGHRLRGALAPSCVQPRPRLSRRARSDAARADRDPRAPLQRSPHARAGARAAAPGAGDRDARRRAHRRGRSHGASDARRGARTLPGGDRRAADERRGRRGDRRGPGDAARATARAHRDGHAGRGARDAARGRSRAGRASRGGSGG